MNRKALGLAAVLPLCICSEAAGTQDRPVYEQDFEQPDSARDFRSPDASSWTLDRGSLWQFRTAAYAPPHRSPHNLAILSSFRLGSFALEADLMQTGREYAHRDLCLVFGFLDPSRYCYAHLSSGADQNAHQLFVVDEAPRTPITTRRTEGLDWGREQWKRVRLEVDREAKTARVLVDGEEVLFSDEVPVRDGYVGFGSFDDEGRFDNLRIWSDEVDRTACLEFAPLRSGERRRDVSFEALSDRIRVRLGEDLFTEYVFRGVPRPYLAPVLGPGGVRMTRAYPMADVAGESRDHPHHTGLWWAHGAINGVDLWHRGGRLLISGEPALGDGRLSARFSLESDSGGAGVTCEQTVTFAETLSGDRWIDFEVELTPAAGERLRFGDTKEGSMAIRTHPGLRLTKDPKATVEWGRGRAQNSEGDRDGALWGRRAAWVDYSGTIEGRRVGVAIFDHPRNPRFPTWWHARDYGLIAANPFGQSAFEGGARGRGDLELPPDQGISFRYRFLFHRFDTEAARVADAAARFGR